MSTTFVKPADAKREWLLVDAEGQVLGRLAARIARILLGKGKPTYVPHQACGDFVVIVNAAKVKITGRKLVQKEYQRYSGYPGGRRVIPMEKMFGTRPEEVVRLAIRRMLPDNRLRRVLIQNVKIYAGKDHPHAAQQPRPIPSPVRGAVGGKPASATA
jgi:large subunit ribosomal protein L13